MAFEVTFYQFSKKRNSTARPTAGGTVYECRIKAPSGILHPVIELSMSASFSTVYNYALIDAFGRYYYVREWTQEPGNIWTAQLDVDALASWKPNIGSQSFYVLRSSAAKDGYVKDTMYPTRAEYTYSVTGGAAGAWWNLATSGLDSLVQGYYVVGLLSYNAGFGLQLVGGLNYIAMIPAQFFSFLGKIFNTSDTSSFMAKTGNAVEAVFSGASMTLTAEEKNNLAYVVENPFTDYIKSITWVPGAPVIGSSPRNSLYLGPNQLTGFEYYPVAVKESQQYTTRFSVQQHPKAGTRGKYLNTEPFTEYYLKLPNMGLVPVPGDLVADQSYIFATLDIDPITGEGLYKLLVSQTDGLVNAIEISRWYAPLGVQVQIAQTKDVGERAQAIANIAGLGLQTLTGNPGALTQLPAAIGEIVKSRNASGQTIGQSGGWLGLGGANGNPVLISIFHDVVDDDNAHNGRPLCKVRTPASLGGYMMIQDADISIPGAEEEADAIKEIMESGFYYE